MRKHSLARPPTIEMGPSSRASVRVPAPGTPRSPQERPPEVQGSVSIHAPRDPAARSLLVPTRTGLLPLTPRGSGWHLLEPEVFVDDEVSTEAGPYSRLFSSAYRIDYAPAPALRERGLSLNLSRANTHSKHTPLGPNREQGPPTAVIDVGPKKATAPAAWIPPHEPSSTKHDRTRSLYGLARCISATREIHAPIGVLASGSYLHGLSVLRKNNGRVFRTTRGPRRAELQLLGDRAAENMPMIRTSYVLFGLLFVSYGHVDFRHRPLEARERETSALPLFSL